LPCECRCLHCRRRYNNGFHGGIEAFSSGSLYLPGLQLLQSGKCRSGPYHRWRWRPSTIGLRF
jgi:hypothetical protein